MSKVCQPAPLGICARHIPSSVAPRTIELATWTSKLLDFQVLYGDTRSQQSAWRAAYKSAFKSIAHLSVLAGVEIVSPGLADKFFWLVEDALPLESLEMSTSGFSPDDGFPLNRLTNCRRLKVKSISFPIDELVSVISRNRETLRAVELRRNYIRSTGSWTDVLLQLCQIPHLTLFHMHHCHYSFHKGPNSDALAQSAVGMILDADFFDMESWDWHILFAERHGLCMDSIYHREDIHTHGMFDSVFAPDWHAVGNVQRHILKNRQAQGLPRAPSDYRNIEYEPVEDLLTSREILRRNYDDEGLIVEVQRQLRASLKAV
jgi:hypothetical protein